MVKKTLNDIKYIELSVNDFNSDEEYIYVN